MKQYTEGTGTKTGSIIGRLAFGLHDAILVILTLLTVATLVLYNIETQASVSNYIDGVVVPTKTEYKIGEKPKFFPLVAVDGDSGANVQITMNCDSAANGFQEVASSESTIIQQTISVKQASRVSEYLESTTANIAIKDDVDQLMRAKAVSLAVPAVTYGGAIPQTKSVCYAYTTMSIKTPIFKLVKQTSPTHYRFVFD